MTDTMTANPFAALLRDVPVYNWPDFDDPDPDGVGNWIYRGDLLAALAAAVPADLAEAGKVAEELLPTLKKGPEYVYRFVDTDNRAADLITTLLARITAMEAQIKGLDAENRDMVSLSLMLTEANNRIAELEARAEAAEAALAEWTSRAIAKAARVAELEAHDGTVMPRDVIRVSAMLIDALHVLDAEAIQIADATNKSGGVDGVQVLEDAEKIIKAAAGLVASELMGVAALTPPADLGGDA